MARLRKKLVFSLVSIIVFYSLVEAALRIANVNFNIPEYFQFTPNFQIDPRLAKGLILKDPLLLWRIAPSKNRGINSKGMRDKEFNIKKPKGVFRIICLGDSVTFGWPNNSKGTYAERLEAILNERIKNRNFEVINAGVSGYTSYQGMRYLEIDIVKYQPDLVTVHFGPDDVAPALYFSDKEQKMQSQWLINLQNLLNKSKFIQFLEKSVFLIKYWSEPINTKYKPRVSPQDYKYNLERMIEIANKYNFKIIFISPVLYNNGNIHFVKGYTLPEKAIVVNLFPVFKNERLSELFIDNCHLTPKGYQLVAEAIADALIKKDLIGGNN